MAIYKEGALFTEVKEDIDNASTSESDKYEELLVNPALLLLTKQRGNIDCGGMHFVLVRYGNFFQLVKPIKEGHVCIDATQNPLEVAPRLDALLTKKGLL